MNAIIMVEAKSTLYCLVEAAVTRPRLGGAKVKCVVPDNIDAHNADVAALFAGERPSICRWMRMLRYGPSQTATGRAAPRPSRAAAASEFFPESGFRVMAIQSGHTLVVENVLPITAIPLIAFSWLKRRQGR